MSKRAAAVTKVKVVEQKKPVASAKQAAQPKQAASIKGKTAQPVLKSAPALKSAPISKPATKRAAKVLTPEEHQRQIEELILNHRDNGRKLARSILRRWRVRMMTDEIDSIVDLTLCEAAKRFSPEFGASFMTFFFYHLRGHLVRAVANAAQASNLFLSFAQSSGFDTLERIFPAGQENAWNYVPEQGVVGNREIDTPENILLRKEQDSITRTACGQLDSLQREIIDRSYSDEQALVDIAKDLGYSRCHISRVKKVALKKLKLIIDRRDVRSEGGKKNRAGRPQGRRTRRPTAQLIALKGGRDEKTFKIA